MHTEDQSAFVEEHVKKMINHIFRHAVYIQFVNKCMYLCLFLSFFHSVYDMISTIGFQDNQH